MPRLRCSLGLLAAIVAVLALDLAVIRSLTRTSAPGSNQWLYMVPVDGTHWLSFVGIALGVLPMATVLVPLTISHAWTIRRGSPVSTFWFGFVAFGWLSVFLFMVIADLSPPAIHGYLGWSGSLISPAITVFLGDSPPELLLQSMELILVFVDFGLPEVVIALLGGWLVARSGSRIQVVRSAPGANLFVPVRSHEAANIGKAGEQARLTTARSE
jgi:hypothetical protein